MWFKTDGGDYINSDTVHTLWVEEPTPSVFRITATKMTSGQDSSLNGTWTSKAAAQEAIRELTSGVDPATYGD